MTLSFSGFFILLQHSNLFDVRRIYLNKKRTVFYVSDTSWDFFSKYLSSDKEIVLDHLLLFGRGENVRSDIAVYRPTNKFDNPFENMRLPTNWPLLDELIKSTNYSLSEYSFIIVPNLNIISLPFGEIRVTVPEGKDVIKEIKAGLGKDNELCDLLKIADKNLGRLLYLNNSNQVEKMNNKDILHIEDYLWGELYTLEFYNSFQEPNNRIILKI